MDSLLKMDPICLFMLEKKHNYSSYEEYKIKHKLIKTKEELKNEGAVCCGICGLYSHHLTSHIVRIHKITTKEYKEKYGEISSKKHCDEQSERVKGDKNPAYNHGGRLSPFSDKFIYSDRTNKQEVIDKMKDSIKNNANHSNKVEYWLKSGYTLEESKEKVSERQRTFSLEKCIEKYGEEQGTKRWAEKQEKWLESIGNSFSRGFSNVSQELFWKISENLEDFSSIYFAELGKDKKIDSSGKNNEYILNLNTRIVKPDFIDKNKNKIIEFDGTYWHSERIVDKTNKLRDKERDKLLKDSGYEVLHISESDYRENPEIIVERCLEFLNG